jgi:hypothetical protein
MKKDTLALSPAAQRRTYVPPTMTIFTLPPRALLAGSTPPDVPVDPNNPGGEALSPETDIFGF